VLRSFGDQVRCRVCEREDSTVRSYPAGAPICDPCVTRGALANAEAKMLTAQKAGDQAAIEHWASRMKYWLRLERGS